MLSQQTWTRIFGLPDPYACNVSMHIPLTLSPPIWHIVAAQ